MKGRNSTVLLATCELLRAQTVHASRIDYSTVSNDRLGDGLLFTSTLLIVQSCLFTYWAFRKMRTTKLPFAPRLALFVLATVLLASGLFGLYLLKTQPLSHSVVQDALIADQ